MKRIVLCLLLLTSLALTNSQTYVELILDASGSMWNTIEDGRYRIVAAKDVLTQFISGLPDGNLNVGLRVYGSQLEAIAEGACEDSKLFVPLSGVDKASLSKTVQDADAIGATPIAFSLLAAADDFPTDAQRRIIILVTDGEESCGGNLQAVAEDLRNRGFEIDIRIIGFDLDDRAIQSFEGVGTFENAESAEELARALDTAVEDIVEEPIAENNCNAFATLRVPESVEASYTFSLPFEGPEGIISLHPVDGDEYSALQTAYTGAANPAELLAPTKAGEYELRYTATAGNCVVATANLIITELAASITVPETVEAGFEFEVPYSGPEGIIALFLPDNTNNQEYNKIGYHFTGWGNPAKITSPTESGTYEVRYLDKNQGTIASGQIEVAASAASITVPETVEAGFEFEVPYSGPEGIIALFLPDNTNNQEYNKIGYHFTGWGNPAKITSPTESGTYEVRYLDKNQGTIASGQIEVAASAASITVPETVEAGFEFEVPYSGPEGIIALFLPDNTNNQEYNKIGYHFTGWGNPAKITSPTESGTYEVRYLDKNQGTIASGQIEVTASTASITIPETIGVELEFEIPYSGPEGIIALFLPDNTNNQEYNKIDYHFTDWGNPAKLTSPIEPGTYEVRYLDKNQGTLTLKQIKVTTP